MMFLFVAKELTCMNKDTPNTPQDIPTNCWDCKEENCRLPYSKTLQNRKLVEYTYKRHPKCKFNKNSYDK